MKVKFVPQNIELEIKPNQSVMNLAHENQIPIRTVCNGMPSCSECRVKIVEGEYNVTPPSRKELNLIGTGYFIDQRRLSCQLYCFGDVTIDLSEQLEKVNEGPVPKKFLARANKDRPEDYNSVGGVLLEEDGDLIKQAEAEIEKTASYQKAPASLPGTGRHKSNPPKGNGRAHQKNHQRPVNQGHHTNIQDQSSHRKKKT